MNEPANRHQHDDQLLPPFRWLTQALASWQLIAGLTLAVFLYLLIGHVPLGSRYLWQHRWVDVTQVQYFRWLPLHIGIMLLAVAVLWATIRRVAWRLRNSGAFVVAVGLAICLIGLSTSLRYGAAGVVTLKPSDDSGLALTTHYADPIERVLVVQFGPNPPTSVPIKGLPRWNDVPPTDGNAEPALSLPLHADAELTRQLDYKARITVVGYLADAEVSVDPSTGQTTVEPTPAKKRGHGVNKYLPTRGALALLIESEDEAGQPVTTFVWLPFEPDGVDRLMPTSRYDVPGMGSIGLAFRPTARELPFALAATPHQYSKPTVVTLHIAETNPSTRQLMPTIERDLRLGQRWVFEPMQSRPGLNQIDLIPVETSAKPNDEPVYIRITNRPGRPLILVGLPVVVIGVFLQMLGLALTSRPKQDASRTDSAAAL